VRFALTGQTREAGDAYLKRTGKRSGQFLFPRRGRGNRCMSSISLADPGHAIVVWLPQPRI
jgi:hypothetical protein